jgi:choline-sulfatase
MILTQRVLWDGPWKFVFNGFDFDELYQLEEDPHELHNLAEEAAYQDQLHQLTQQMWHQIKASGDYSLLNSHYPIMRVAAVGPLENVNLSNQQNFIKR